MSQFGVLAEFDSAYDIYHASEKIRDKGFTRWDTFTPFPVHGLEDAMGLKPSKVPWITLIAGLTGASCGFALQTWVHTIAYPIIHSGKPHFSWPAFIPITFEPGILFAAFGTVFGMLALNGLPRHNYPAFNAKRFKRVTDDKFFVLIEAADPKYGHESTQVLLKELGATHVEIVEEEDE